MKKKGYYEYENGIYPLKLWVHIGKDLKELIDSCFDKCKTPDSDVGGSRGGNKRNFMSRYLGKFNIPQYENNDELSNEDCKAFKAITDKMRDTYKRKNHDYGNAFSEMYDELGINYGYGKVREKVNRIKTLKDNEAQVANEPLEDALLDCANYCILTLMEYQKRKEHGTD